MNNDNQLPPAPVAEELNSNPVAWMDQEGCLHTTEESAYFRGRPVTPLYTHPQTAVDVDALAEFIRTEPLWLRHEELARRIRNWIEEQKNDQ